MNLWFYFVRVYFQHCHLTLTSSFYFLHGFIIELKCAFSELIVVLDLKKCALHERQLNAPPIVLTALVLQQENLHIGVQVMVHLTSLYREL